MPSPGGGRGLYVVEGDAVRTLNSRRVEDPREPVTVSPARTCRPRARGRDPGWFKLEVALEAPRSVSETWGASFELA
jgi:hypothetical protein